MDADRFTRHRAWRLLQNAKPESGCRVTQTHAYLRLSRADKYLLRGNFDNSRNISKRASCVSLINTRRLKAKLPLAEAGRETSMTR
jgi:hypothetical protein